VVSAAAVSPDRRARWPPAIAAAAAAFVLVPLHNRLQRLVHRVVYGRWREPYEVLSGIAAQLEAAADADRLLETANDLCRLLDKQYEVGTRMARFGAGLLHQRVADNDGASEFAGKRLEPARCIHGGADDSDSSAISRHLGGTLHARALLHDLQHTRERLVLARRRSGAAASRPARRHRAGSPDSR
jgi:hypothetical protein